MQMRKKMVTWLPTHGNLVGGLGVRAGGGRGVYLRGLPLPLIFFLKRVVNRDDYAVCFKPFGGGTKTMRCKGFFAENMVCYVGLLYKRTLC